jgi:hypothetical protein
MIITDIDILMVKGYLRDKREFRYEAIAEQDKITMQVFAAIKSQDKPINADSVLAAYLCLRERSGDDCLYL